MSKKGALDQMLLYVLAVFISALILFYGYKAITSLQHRAEEIALVRFEKSLQAKIETLISQYDSVRIEDFSIPQGVEKICFADLQQGPGTLLNTDSAGLCAAGGQNYNPVICNAIKEKTDTVFLLPTFQNLYIKKIQVLGGTLCIPSRGGLLTLRLTGKGDGTLVEEISRGQS